MDDTPHISFYELTITSKEIIICSWPCFLRARTFLSFFFFGSFPVETLKCCTKCVFIRRLCHLLHSWKCNDGNWENGKQGVLAISAWYDRAKHVQNSLFEEAKLGFFPDMIGFYDEVQEWNIFPADPAQIIIAYEAKTSANTLDNWAKMIWRASSDLKTEKHFVGRIENWVKCDFLRFLDLRISPEARTAQGYWRLFSAITLSFSTTLFPLLTWILCLNPFIWEMDPNLRHEVHIPSLHWHLAEGALWIQHENRCCSKKKEKKNSHKGLIFMPQRALLLVFCSRPVDERIPPTAALQLSYFYFSVKGTLGSIANFMVFGFCDRLHRWPRSFYSRVSN